MRRARIVKPDDEDYERLHGILAATRQPDRPFGAIVEAVSYKHFAMPMPVLKMHPHRTRGEMMEEHFTAFSDTSSSTGGI